MKKNLLFPLDLQYFADPEEKSEITEEVVSPAAEDNEKIDPVDSEKIIEKLQKRLDFKTKEERESKSQLDQALERIKELEKGTKKSVKEKSEEEKVSEMQKAKDEEINKLRTQIKIADVTQQADEVLKESGLTVNKDVLSILVHEDEEKTYSNVKAFVEFLNKQEHDWEVKRNTGTTPTISPSKKVIDPFDVIKNKYK